VPKITGDFAVGEKVILTLVTERSPQSRKTHAKIVEITPPNQLSWQGMFIIPSIAHTRHVFALKKLMNRKPDYCTSKNSAALLLR
jgi:hypothetical protein